MVKPEINGEVGPFWQYGTVPQANFQPLAWVTYARYDPAVKDKQSLNDMSCHKLAGKLDCGSNRVE